VWGGDLGCEHEWGALERSKKGDRAPKDGMASNDALGASEFAQGGAPLNGGNFCRRCNAWIGHLGLEPTPELYIAHLVLIFREVRRVLRKDGTLWVVIGDSYAGSWGNQGRKDNRGSQRPINGPMLQNLDPYPDKVTNTGKIPADAMYKSKDLLGIPWMMAFALRADGWWLRQENTWCKTSAMPESVEDRSTRATESVFMFAKSARYFYDKIAVAEACHTDPKENYPARAKITGRGQQGFAEARGDDRDKSGGFPPSEGGTRNQRNWWVIGPEPFPGSHFAVMPCEIPRRAILAGTSAKGVCPKCAAPWVRQANVSYTDAKRGMARNQNKLGDDRAASCTLGYEKRLDKHVETIGWRPSCSCDADVGGCFPLKPATVLDCFLGSGTTALVADQLGRDCIGIELNSAYAEMAERRLRDDAGMFADLAAE
jgi:DNA modification methylase